MEFKHAVEKHARKAESAKGRRDALDCLSAEQGDIQISESDLDTNPYLLNCLSGTIDLRDGSIHAHLPEDYISKLIPIKYDPDAECPVFLRFVYEIMGDNCDAEPNEKAVALVDFLQLLLGAAATGIPEKILIVLYGTGNNGKTTLIEIIRDVLGNGEYAGEVNIESLMAKAKDAGSNNAINSDLADLRGCRFVSSSEVEQGQRLSLSRVKYLTGMGQVKARRLHENWMTFRPTHKIFLDANHKPVISDPTDAIWNRVKCVPFGVEIPPEKRDKDLPHKLRAEMSGILNWIVKGAIRYLRDGLGSLPIDVDEATEAYRQQSDPIGDFFEERCVVEQNNERCWIYITQLYSTYSSWAESSGLRYTLPKPDFNERVAAKGFHIIRPGDGSKSEARPRAWAGIRLRETT
jgi:putative DNA primase/helicase